MASLWQTYSLASGMSNIIFISLSTTSQHISTNWDYVNTITQNYSAQSMGIPHLLCLPGWSWQCKENMSEPVFSLIWGHLYFSHPAGVYLINNGSLKSSQVAWDSSVSRALLVEGRQHRETCKSIHPVQRQIKWCSRWVLLYSERPK